MANNYTTMKKAELIEVIKNYEARINELENEKKMLNFLINKYESLMKEAFNSVNGTKDTVAVPTAPEHKKSAPSKPVEKSSVEKPSVGKSSVGKSSVKNSATSPVANQATEKKATDGKTTENNKQDQQYDHKYIPAWRLKKYGSVENVLAVDAMVKIVRDEWAAIKKSTGKNVVARKDYATKLYEEAERRVMAQKKGENK